MPPDRAPKQRAPQHRANQHRTDQQADVYQQTSLDELLTVPRLRDLTFVVVDLETTGTNPGTDSITEIGAVKTRSGERIGEFTTLINPGVAIPPLITALTGITRDMVANAPPAAAVLPAFLEFAAGAVLVAHNARFDVGFLRRACARYGYRWPKPAIVDTVTLARRILGHGEVPNNKLGTLAAFFRATTTPNHRALDDARATVDVLHALLERVGNRGVATLGELLDYTANITPAQRSKRHLTADVPAKPGVYIFRGNDDRPLYVGTSTNLASRVRQYFGASETRARMREMITATDHIDTITCSHQLEAQIRELRLIAATKPPYNRRDKYPERALWLRLTDEPYPRLSLVRAVTEQQRYLGPFSSQRAARAAAAAIHEALPIRQCTAKLSVRRPSSACVLAELGKCGAPCEHRESVADYEGHITALEQAITADPEPIIGRLLARMAQLAAHERYEDAARLRDQTTTLLRTVHRAQRLRAFETVTDLVAASRTADGEWDIALISHARLTAAAKAATADVLSTVEVLRATTSSPDVSAGGVAEAEHLLRWLERPGTRIVAVDTPWVCPTRGAGRLGDLLARLLAAAPRF